MYFMLFELFPSFTYSLLSVPHAIGLCSALCTACSTEQFWIHRVSPVSVTRHPEWILVTVHWCNHVKGWSTVITGSWGTIYWSVLSSALCLLRGATGRIWVLDSAPHLPKHGQYGGGIANWTGLWLTQCHTFSSRVDTHAWIPRVVCKDEKGLPDCAPIQETPQTGPDSMLKTTLQRALCKTMPLHSFCSELSSLKHCSTWRAYGTERAKDSHPRTMMLLLFYQWSLFTMTVGKGLISHCIPV